MKRAISFLVAAFGITLAASCVHPEKDEKQWALENPLSGPRDAHSDVRQLQVSLNANAALDEPGGTIGDASVPAIPSSKATFDTIVAYVEKHGCVVFEKSVPSDHQFTFFDSQGNRHAIIVTRRKGNEPSIEGAARVHVWAYYKGIRDHDHFFSWYVDSNRAYTADFKRSYAEKHMPAVEKGYDEFLAKVRKG